jgi:hypothetical protein
MGARHYCPSRGEGLLPRARRMMTMGFSGWETLVEAVMSLLYALIRQSNNSGHFTLALHQANNSEFWCNHQRTSSTITLRIMHHFSSMPRERGRSRRGPAWHSFVARQRRRQQLERALSIARTQRTQAALREKVRSPPMAYVEEVIPEEPLQSLQNPSSSPCQIIGSPQAIFQRKPVHQTQTGLCMEEAKEVHTCIMEEEFPRNSSTLTPRTPCFQVTSKFSNTAEEDEELGMEEKDGMEKDKDGSTGGYRRGCRWYDGGGWPSPSATTYHDNPGTMARPPHPSSTRTTGVSVRASKPDGRSDPPRHTHAPVHRHVI